MNITEFKLMQLAGGSADHVPHDCLEELRNDVCQVCGSRWVPKRSEGREDDGAWATKKNRSYRHMTMSGEIQQPEIQPTARKTGGGDVSGEDEPRCKAILKQGSIGENGKRVSFSGDRCLRKHKLVDGLCWMHRKYGGQVSHD